MTIEVRRTRPEEYRTASDTVSTALHFGRSDDDAWERSIASWEESSSFSAWDGDRCVGHAAQFFVDTTVPGGRRVATGAVSRVGVLATHRRQRVGTLLLESLIVEATESGLVLMSLRASESTIYRRYGFGIAGEYSEIEIDTARARPIRGAADGGSFRLLRADEIHDTIHDIYERSLHRRPGLITRPQPWWQRLFKDAESATKPSLVVVHADDDGVDDGYAHYDVAWNQDGTPGAKGAVHDVVAVDDGVELALWRYLLDIDLVRTWTADERPIDDIVKWAASDTRAYTVKGLDDEQWVRIVDVDAALAARSYGPAHGAVTIAVNDPLVATNNGTWTVTAEGSKPSEAEPDLLVGISTLSAAYLGGTSWATLAAVGEVEVRTPGVVAIADTLFASHPLPFCGTFF